MSDRMSSIPFFRHTNTSLVQQFLKNYFPASLPIFHRIRSHQNIPERQTLLLANFTPIQLDVSTELDVYGPAMISFVDRSRPNESQVAIFSTLCLRAADSVVISKESRKLLADQLRELLRTIHHIGNSYAAADVKPLNYPFSPILRFTASDQTIADILIHDLAVNSSYYYEWDELIFSTPQVKRILSARRLPEGYELGSVPSDKIDVITSTSKVKREVATLLQNHNAAVLFTDPNTAYKELVAWAYLSIDQSLTTMYVLPEHRGKGLAKLVAASLMGDLCDGLVGAGKTQSDWCFAQVAADNLESQKVCKALGAVFNKRTVTLGFNLEEWIRDSKELVC